MLEPFHLYLLLGVVLIVIEIVLLQLMFGWVLLLGVAAILTAVIGNFFELNYLQSNITMLLLSLAIITICIKPLMRWQRQHKKPSDSSDIIGRKCQVVETVTANGGAVKFSGTKWQAQLSRDAADQSVQIKPNSDVYIKKVKGIVLFVSEKP